LGLSGRSSRGCCHHCLLDDCSFERVDHDHRHIWRWLRSSRPLLLLLRLERAVRLRCLPARSCRAPLCSVQVRGCLLLLRRRLLRRRLLWLLLWLLMLLLLQTRAFRQGFLAIALDTRPLLLR
jgi:hypothetical protein